MSHLKTIRLELGRTPEFPDGSASRGYEFKAPLTENGDLDPAAFMGLRALCTVKRFWQGEDDQIGQLHHTRHRQWAFSYRPGEDDDEPLYRLDRHHVKIGEYLTITEQDGSSLPFRITRIF